ncbi:Rv3654c family TadE-like protein [Nakamurella lactea]|uniref:Rv3654c family TadE-like protein n=1 Tax=Nakamurella lactea TaxID=459515 RepID=UPI00040B8E76|nr:Rv3654c family TadE-like protein [Nakamurella lactea]
MGDLRGRKAADGGYATVLTAIGGAALLALLIIALQIGGAVIARHRAEGAADLAALAGATAVQSGTGSACQRAGAIAAANGGSVLSCELSGSDVLVVVVVRNQLLPAVGSAQGRARAGPVVSGEGERSPGGR